MVGAVSNGNERVRECEAAGQVVVRKRSVQGFSLVNDKFHRGIKSYAPCTIN